ncbi:MAG: hypothetical protein VX064_00065 [Pseudomonadota bacterium]|nr:hypothetical protein [Pseudomonadota bacterium]
MQSHGFNEESDALNARSVGQDGRMSDRIAGGGQFPLLGEVQQAGRESSQLSRSVFK